MLKIIGRKNLAELLCRQDTHGYTIVDYIAQYCHNTADLSALLDMIDANTWESILDWQIANSSHESALHQAAHWQNKGGVSYF